LKLDERGRPVDGAVEIDLERVIPDEDDSASEGIVELAMAARYWMTFFVFSVLPAPDSPLEGVVSQYSEAMRGGDGACGKRTTNVIRIL
jgi:hypothetical protein